MNSSKEIVATWKEILSNPNTYCALLGILTFIVMFKTEKIWIKFTPKGAKIEMAKKLNHVVKATYVGSERNSTDSDTPMNQQGNLYTYKYYVDGKEYRYNTYVGLKDDYVYYINNPKHAFGDQNRISFLLLIGIPIFVACFAYYLLVG